jgi:TetR/AcrR family transcriptional regulator
VLSTWLEPLRAFDADGNPESEIRSYIRRKLEMARDFPRESRLFANEVLQGAPHIEDELKGPLKELVDEKAEVIRGWARAGKITRCDPYHLIFSIWSTTQHYADFDAQVRAVLGQNYAGEGRFEDAARFLEQLFMDGLRMRAGDGSSQPPTPARSDASDNRS